MKVRELIELLQNFEEDDEVGFAYNYGDYGQTVVVANIEEADTFAVTYSHYHEMMRLADEKDCEDEDEEVTRMVVLQ